MAFHSSLFVYCSLLVWHLVPFTSRLQAELHKPTVCSMAFSLRVFFTNRLSNVDSNHDSLNALTFLLFLSYMLKNGPTYFKNLEV